MNKCVHVTLKRNDFQHDGRASRTFATDRDIPKRRGSATVATGADHRRTVDDQRGKCMV
jgi:hypothetical protein